MHRNSSICLLQPPRVGSADTAARIGHAPHKHYATNQIETTEGYKEWLGEHKMIRKKTVFVVGAGASKPFGLPLGGELKGLVLTDFQEQGGPAIHLYNTTKFELAAVREFVERLKYSGLASVDAFLERRPEYLEIGKATMGIELLIRESTIQLWPTADWLSYLYNYMVGKALEEFEENEVSFVTFNYDRIIEHFFYVSLLNAFGQSEEKTAQVLSTMPVIHLHGRLGYLPWQNDNEVIPFGHANIDPRTMSIMLDQIKVVHEDIADGRDKAFDAAKNLLHQAERVYLLGFGFGALNTERLGLDSIEPPIYCGTAYQLSSKENSEMKEMLGGKVELHNVVASGFLQSVATLN